ncbi:MAG: hypothetical protein FJY92_09400, partial [Candidatus Hydrogenedentes bacterium]|nr:hypothetical protein [Candidatus Hydrogenedentota bacterium]
MRRHCIVSLLLIAVAVFPFPGCTTVPATAHGPHAAGDWLLLPMPREFEVSATVAGRAAIAGTFASVHTVIDADRVPHAQGYDLTIAAARGRAPIVRVTAHDDAGAFYAEQTLMQLEQQARAKGCVPLCRIVDWPDFPDRGVMLDVARCKVPKMKTLYELVDLFASWKYNQIQLYTEHTFAYRNHPTVWHDASPMTPAQVRDLDAYCRARYIQLVPNQNSFAHMGRWLMHPE